MRNFPETISTKQDIENIRNNHPEMHDQLKAVLARAASEPTKMDVVVSHDTDPKTDEMTNVITERRTCPNPQWKRWGFKNRAELTSKIATLEASMK